MKQHLLSILTLGLILGFLSSCNDDDPEPVNEEELITDLIYTLTPRDGGDVVTLRFSDPDGDGGEDPDITTEPLTANKIYDGSIQVLGPDENITEEIEEEEEEHQFFFQVGEGLQLVINYSDQDGNGNPVGLETIAASGDAGNGTLTITLRHEPDKNADGVSDGDISNAGGETDIEVTFDIEIE